MSGNKIIQDYQIFMQKHQIGKDAEKGGPIPNFMSMGKPYGKFHVPPEDMNEFYRLYTNVIMRTQHPVHLVERPGFYSPVKIDIDLNFARTGDRTLDQTRKYTADMVKELVSEYRREIEHFFDTASLKKGGYRAYVFEKPTPTLREHDVKDGFHILFSVISDSKTQQLIRMRVLPKIMKIFGELNPTNKPEDILDRTVSEKGNWMVYGSSKPKQPKYELTRAYVLKTGEHRKYMRIKMDKLNPFSFPKMFNVGGHTKMTSFVNKEKHEEVNEWYDKKMKVGRKRERKELEQIIEQLRIQNNRNIFVDITVEPRERIVQLINALNPRRADNYSEWMEVGWCLHNICPDYLDIWISFSKKSQKYERGVCEKKWDNFDQREDGLTISSLYFWVKQDSPEDYQRIKEGDVFGLAIKHMTGTHYDLACLMYAMFKDKFVCADLNSKLWFKFNGIRWVESMHGYEVRQKLSTELVNLFNRIIAFFEQKSAEMKNEEKRKSCGAVILFAQQISFKLKNETFKARVMDSCKQKFFDPDFVTKLDSNQHLLGFENGIYDFAAQKFRPGKPEDFVSMSTGINYIKYNKNHAMHNRIKQFFRQIAPVKRMRSYLKRLASTFLSGYNAEQKFNIFIGVGSNGKSVLINLLRSILGDYFAKLNVALITKKRGDANTASPELAKMKGKRLCVFDEPNHNEPLNLGIMKILTGADAITARKLFGTPFEFVPQCKLVLLTNHLPIIKQGDNGVWRRISVFEFMSRFCDDPNPKRKFEFKIDRTLNDQLQAWREHMMSMLIHIYTTKYMKDKIKEPEEVVKYTKRYEEKSDHYKRFMTETLKKVKDKKKSIRLNALYGELKMWYRASFPSNKDCPTKSDLGEYMMDNFDPDEYNPAKRRLYGYIVWDDEDNSSEEGDELEA